MLGERPLGLHVLCVGFDEAHEKTKNSVSEPKKTCPPVIFVSKSSGLLLLTCYSYNAFLSASADTPNTFCLFFALWPLGEVRQWRAVAIGKHAGTLCIIELNYHYVIDRLWLPSCWNFGGQFNSKTVFLFPHKWCLRRSLITNYFLFNRKGPQFVGGQDWILGQWSRGQWDCRICYILCHWRQLHHRHRFLSTSFRWQSEREASVLKNVEKDTE